MPSITGANASIALSITGLFPAPQLLQGFEADNVFSTEDIDNVEYRIGVDGVLSAGFVYVAINQTFMFQADSASNDIFDLWNSTMVSTENVLFAQAVVTLTSIGKKWQCQNGVLTRFKPIPDVKKLIEPRHYTVTWQRVLPAST